MNPGALSIKPLFTFNWTPTHFHLNPSSTLKWVWGLIFTRKKIKKIYDKNFNFFLVKALNLKILLVLYSKKKFFNLGIPIRKAIPVSKSYLQVSSGIFVEWSRVSWNGRTTLKWDFVPFFIFANSKPMIFPVWMPISFTCIKIRI